MRKESKSLRVQAAKLLGSKGGKASAAKLTKDQRRERARKAITARWAKVKAELAKAKKAKG